VEDKVNLGEINDQRLFDGMEVGLEIRTIRSNLDREENNFIS